MKLVNISQPIKTIIILLVGTISTALMANEPLNSREEIQSQLEKEMEMLKKWSAPPSQNSTEQIATQELDSEDVALLEELDDSKGEDSFEDSVSLGQAAPIRKPLPKKAETHQSKTSEVKKFSNRRIRSR